VVSLRRIDGSCGLRVSFRWLRTSPKLAGRTPLLSKVMQRAIRGLTYVVAFLLSAAVSALSLSRMLILLPSDTLGLLLAVIIFVALTWGLAFLERSLLWSHWLQPRGEEPVSMLRAQSSLLSGRAPPPFAMGAVAGAVWVAKTF
jgi:hypothetical protein